MSDFLEFCPVAQIKGLMAEEQEREGLGRIQDLLGGAA